MRPHIWGQDRVKRRSLRHRRVGSAHQQLRAGYSWQGASGHRAARFCVHGKQGYGGLENREPGGPFGAQARSPSRVLGPPRRRNTNEREPTCLIRAGHLSVNVHGNGETVALNAGLAVFSKPECLFLVRASQPPGPGLADAGTERNRVPPAGSVLPTETPGEPHASQVCGFRCFQKSR